MDTNLDTTPTGDVAEKATTEAEAQATDSSSSKEGETDYDALIANERGSKPDPDKALEAFKKREEKRKSEEAPEPEGDVDLDKPMTRREADEYFARRQHQIVTETQAERITEIANDLAESPKEAEFIMEIHRNRIYPEGMSLREQLQEAHIVANGKRLLAKNLELGRKVQSKETASKDVASTHHEPTEGTAPRLKADIAQALKNAGFTYDNSSKVYVKSLPNGKKLYKDPANNRTWSS